MDWIDIADRMPEAGQFLWAYDKAQGVVLAYYEGYDPDSYGAKHGYNWQSAESAGDSEGLNVEYYHHVTHWMPLVEPEPPVCPSGA